MNRYSVSILLLLLPPALSAGCSFLFIPVDPVESTNPSGEGSILRKDERISVRFSLPVDRNAAEELLLVSDGPVLIPGDYVWPEEPSEEKQVLDFIPHTPLQPGKKYTLSFVGTLPGRTGGTYETGIRFFFFSVFQSGGPPVTVEILPSAGDFLPLRGSVTFRFCRPMDTDSVEESFHLFPPSVPILEWNTRRTLLTVSPPEPGWLRGTVHTFSLQGATEDFRSSLEQRLSVSYQTGSQDAAPSVLRIERGREDGETGFVLLEPDSEGFRPPEKLRVLFSEAMDQRSPSRYLSFDPAIPGSWNFIGGDILEFTPEEPFPYRRRVLFTIDPDYPSVSGTALGETFSIHLVTGFTDTLTLLEIGGRESDGFPVALTAEPGIMPVSPIDPEGSYYFFLVFDRQIESSPARLSVQKSVSASVVFPRDITNPVTVSNSWIRPDVLMVRITGFGGRNEGRQCYYRLNLLGGPSGAMGDGGQIMKNSISLPLRYTP